MRQKSILQTLSEFGVEPSDIFKGFMQAMAEMANDGWGQSSDNSASFDEGETDDNPVEEENEEMDFAMINPWDPFGIDSDDPRLSRGMEMGILEAVAVHSEPEQNRLLPLSDGMLIGEDY